MPEKDPVCGMMVDAESAAATATHAGKSYYFCSSHCGAKFRENPTQFIGAASKGTEAKMGNANPAAASTDGGYGPLITVIAMILVTTVALAWSSMRDGSWSIESSIRHFMIGFFLVFAGFKLVDLKGFAEGYQTYDLLASRVPAYGYVYPFIELGFGLAMILLPESLPLLWAEVAVMSFSGLGVAIKLAKKEPFQCACLGTFLKVPLTKVTLVEDFGMAGLALLMIFLL